MVPRPESTLSQLFCPKHWPITKLTFLIQSYFSDFSVKRIAKTKENGQTQKAEKSPFLQYMMKNMASHTLNLCKFAKKITQTHWTYWLHILSKLCFQRVALSGNYEILAICTDKNTFLMTLIIKLTLGNIFIKVKNPPGGATVTK